MIDRRLTVLRGFVAGLALLLVACGTPRALWAMAAEAHEGNDFAQAATWTPPTADLVKEQSLSWLGEHGASPTERAAAEAIWSAASGSAAASDPLDRLVATFALVDPEAAELAKLCSGPRTAWNAPDLAWLADEKLPALERNNLRLAYGRWLAQETLYDESLEQIGGLKPEEVVDPASLLFYQAVIHHRLLHKDEALETIARLLEREKEIPRRFESLARLMQSDMTPLDDESLDHIARRMDDIRRRLDLGRAGPKVREVEDGVIESLDKLIKKIEDQEQAAAAAMAARQPQGGPSAPAPESIPLQGKGPGNVTKKDIGKKSGWGDLPPKDRQEALQQIGQEFPAHYRDIIEQYFRKLASESEEKQP